MPTETILARMRSAVANALESKQLRDERKQAEATLRKSEERSILSEESCDLASSWP